MATFTVKSSWLRLTDKDGKRGKYYHRGDQVELTSEQAERYQKLGAVVEGDLEDEGTQYQVQPPTPTGYVTQAPVTVPGDSNTLRSADNAELPETSPHNPPLEDETASGQGENPEPEDSDEDLEDDEDLFSQTEDNPKPGPFGN